MEEKEIDDVLPFFLRFVDIKCTDNCDCNVVNGDNLTILLDF